jgi:hypothetical protein
MDAPSGPGSFSRVIFKDHLPHRDYGRFLCNAGKLD